MSVFSIGEVLRKHRIALGISQEDLCDGICSVPTLSRIENGVRVPNKAHFDALMQRMGQSGEMYDTYMGKKDFEIHELKFNIRIAIMEQNYDLAGELLSRFKEISISKDHINQQFITYMEVLIEDKRHYTEDTLRKLEKALSYTMPKYGKVSISEQLLTFDEITIINNIAIYFANIGNVNRGIEIFYELKNFMDKKLINTEEKMKTYPMILYNLSKYLGLTKRYDECIEICDVGIDIAVKSGKTRLLCNIIFNKAWCLAEMKDMSKEYECKKLILESYYMATSVGRINMAEQIKDYGLKNCPTLKEEYF